MPESDLDAVDRRIIAALQGDGRLSNVELADRVGLSPSPCLRRVKQLEREGYIEGYRAVLRRDRVGLGFSVFIGVKMLIMEWYKMPIGIALGVVGFVLLVSMLASWFSTRGGRAGAVRGTS